jgi:3,4-dihydroxy 2-butanone 4-phosphate synthase/GTP cyclohydrolase II
MPTCTVEEALAEIRNGRMIILVDDEGRENEGDLTMAAEFVTADSINFMARFGRGLICLALEAEIVDRLDLPLMVRDNTSKFGTGFTISIEAKNGVTTGISAADRAVTIRTAIAPDARSLRPARPGHVFPLRARRGRCPRAHGTDRGLGGPLQDGGAQARRGDLRGHERRRHHEPGGPSSRSSPGSTG